MTKSATRIPVSGYKMSHLKKYEFKISLCTLIVQYIYIDFLVLQSGLIANAFFLSQQIKNPFFARSEVGFLGTKGFHPSIILPETSYDGNLTYDVELSSNQIDYKRFIESHTSRCFTSTIWSDPSKFESHLVLFKPHAETKLRANINPKYIAEAGFDPSLQTYIFVHGFTQNYPDTPWLRHARALFEKNHLTKIYNVFVVDWSVGAGLNYPQAASQVSLQGAFLANFIQKLIDLGANKLKFHLICHSLGAHVCGFAGKRLRPRIGRITALDAAGPCFGKVASNGPNDRLSQDDAIEVDFFHYDDSFLGIGPGQYGQFDIYVNGGQNQPGAKGQAETVWNAGMTVLFNRNNVLSESHSRSYEVATSLLSGTQCRQIAYECKDWKSFTQGECGFCDQDNNQCFEMDFPFQYRVEETLPRALRTSFPGKKLFISTGGDGIFCQQHYQILIRTEPMSSESKSIDYKFELELSAPIRGRLNTTVTNRLSTNVYSNLLLIDGFPVRFQAGAVRIKHPLGLRTRILSALSERIGRPNTDTIELRILQIDINFMSHESYEVRNQYSSKLCVLESSIDENSSDLIMTQCRGVRGSLV